MVFRVPPRTCLTSAPRFSRVLREGPRPRLESNTTRQRRFYAHAGYSLKHEHATSRPRFHTHTHTHTHRTHRPWVGGRKANQQQQQQQDNNSRLDRLTNSPQPTMHAVIESRFPRPSTSGCLSHSHSIESNRIESVNFSLTNAHVRLRSLHLLPRPKHRRYTLFIQSIDKELTALRSQRFGARLLEAYLPTLFKILFFFFFFFIGLSSRCSCSCYYYHYLGESGCFDWEGCVCVCVYDNTTTTRGKCVIGETLKRDFIFGLLVVHDAQENERLSTSDCDGVKREREREKERATWILCTRDLLCNLCRYWALLSFSFCQLRLPPPLS